MVLVFYFSAISIIGAPVGALLFEEIVVPSKEDWLPLFGLGFIAAIGQVMTNRGLQLEKAARYVSYFIALNSFSRASSMNYIQIVFAFTWDSVFLHHVPSYFSVLGALLITGYAFFTAFKAWRTPKQ